MTPVNQVKSVQHLLQLSTVCIAILMTSLVTLYADERPPELEMLQPGVSLTLVAEHPQLATPTGIDVDEEGRIWCVATHTHFRPDNYVGPEHDEILIFKPHGASGSADRQVFYNKTTATMDLELGPDGWVYLAERDRILRIKDTDGDGQADLEENIVTLTTEADYPHNGMEALAWDLDGRLIFGLGENYSKPWVATGTDGATVTGTGEGGIFRCEPDGAKLERIAYGFWNPFGICVRQDGSIFAAENDPGERPPCRLLHIIEGGDYGYQRSYGPEAHHPFVGWNGELRGTLPMLHPSGEAPCGIQPLGQGLLVPTWSDHRIDFYPLKQNGASYSSERIKLVHGSRYFRPSCISPGVTENPNRPVWYLCDWVDGRYQAHGYGRVWKLEIDLEKADWVGDLELPKPTLESEMIDALRAGRFKGNTGMLLKLAQHSDPFVARVALLELSKETENWTKEEVAQWETANRIQAVLALKLSGASDKSGPKMFLEDESQDVLFETLRWIADAKLKQFLPEVEEILTRSDLEFQQFEAAIATWNTLNGHPELGVRNPELLLARIQDGESSPRIRAYALRLLPTQPRIAKPTGEQPTLQFPNGLTLELLEKLFDLGDPELSKEVVQTLSGNPIKAEALLRKIASDANVDSSLRARAIVGLGAAGERNVDLLLELIQDDEPVIRQEALRNLRSVSLGNEQSARLVSLKEMPEDIEAYNALLNPKSFSNDRPKPTDTTAWLELMNSVEAPVDIAAGERIFHNTRLAQCTNCHRHNGRGNVVGPDLSNIHRGKVQKDLLQAILEPSRQMAPEYQARTVLLKDGTVFTGIRLRSSTQEAMRDTNGQNRSFNRNDIESMVDSPVSFMPEGLANRLTIRELRDLLAFLRQNE